MMMETKILMNLAPHPNICQIYGVTAAGSDAFLSRGREGFYIILDRLSGTLVQRLQQWREQEQERREKMLADGASSAAIIKAEHEKLMERMEVALDIGSALLFLSDRQIVFNLRPEKVGFDCRYGRILLCDFGQARKL
jgi:DNA-binding XRE family transcriptional regulator